MKVIVQRSKESSVSVDNKLINKIDSGLVLLVGFTEGDDESKLINMAKKIVNLRIFDDDAGVMNKSILDVGGEVLSISQFTLYADTKKGNRPSYIKALKSDEATILYNKFNELLNQKIKVETGIFGAEMEVSLINDGPITIILDSEGIKWKIKKIN